MDREDALALDRLVHLASDIGVVPARGGDLQALFGGIMAERGDDLLPRAREAALRKVVSEQVDRGNECLRLEGEQSRRLGEAVSVGLRVDLDLVALQLGVEDVCAAAEVDDVE